MENGPHPSVCSSWNGIAVRLELTLINLYLCLAWMHAVQIEAFCVYAWISHCGVVGYLLARWRYYIVFQIILDCRFSTILGSKLNRSPIWGQGCQCTWTSNLVTVQCKSFNPCEFGGLSAGRPVGPSVDSDNEFALPISILYLVKIADLAVNILCLQGVLFTIWIILQFMFSL